MKVVVDGAAGTVGVVEADNLKALSVELHSVEEARANLLLKGFGWIADGHAWLSIDELRTYGPVPNDREWNAHFDATMEWAKSKGWTEVSGQFVRAHIETLSA